MAKRLKVKVKFFLEEKGGRHQLPPDLLSYRDYRPHFVVGNPDQKHSVVDEQNRGLEEYLGVAFVAQEEAFIAGKEIIAEVLMSYEGVDYSALCQGATFTIREGGSIVGNGQVL